MAAIERTSATGALRSEFALRWSKIANVLLCGVESARRVRLSDPDHARRMVTARVHSLSCTDGEWNRTKARAQRRGMSISRYMVERALNVDPRAAPPPHLVLDESEQRDMHERIALITERTLAGTTAFATQLAPQRAARYLNACSPRTTTARGPRRRTRPPGPTARRAASRVCPAASSPISHHRCPGHCASTR